MRIFLDFDGVLRSDSSPTSRLDADCVEHFPNAVLSASTARIVITSTWRLVHRLDALRALFPGAVAQRIEGATADLPEVEEYVRYAEILAYLARRNLHGTPWLAVDDNADEFRPGARLLMVDPATGFDAACSDRLQRWLSDRR